MKISHVVIGLIAVGTFFVLRELGRFLDGFDDPFTSYFCEEGGEINDKEQP